MGLEFKLGSEILRRGFGIFLKFSRWRIIALGRP